jgi:hypothetical protein
LDEVNIRLVACGKNWRDCACVVDPEAALSIVVLINRICETELEIVEVDTEVYRQAGAEDTLISKLHVAVCASS